MKQNEDFMLKNGFIKDYNDANIYYSFYGVQTYEFKAKYFEKNETLFCLSDIAKDVSANNL